MTEEQLILRDYRLQRLSELWKELYEGGTEREVLLDLIEFMRAEILESSAKK